MLWQISARSVSPAAGPWLTLMGWFRQGSAGGLLLLAIRNLRLNVPHPADDFGYRRRHETAHRGRSQSAPGPSLAARAAPNLAAGA